MRPHFTVIAKEGELGASVICSSKRGFRHQAPNQFGTRGQIKFLFPGLSVPEGVKVEMFARVINFLHPLAVV